MGHVREHDPSPQSGHRWPLCATLGFKDSPKVRATIRGLECECGAIVKPWREERQKSSLLRKRLKLLDLCGLSEEGPQ